MTTDEEFKPRCAPMTKLSALELARATLFSVHAPLEFVPKCPQCDQIRELDKLIMEEKSVLPEAGFGTWTPIKDGSPPWNPEAENVLAATITGRIVSVHPNHVQMLREAARRDNEDCYYTHWMTLPRGPQPQGKPE